MWSLRGEQDMNTDLKTISVFSVAKFILSFAHRVIYSPFVPPSLRLTS